MKKTHFLLALLLTIYFILSFTTFLVWNSKNKYSVTGDEPSYLVMASGLVKYGVLEQTKPYKEEFKTREIYKPGLASPEANPSPENTHTVQGPNGLFSIHNIGLPLIISIPFLLGGVFGAKIFMILVGGIAVVVVWKISNIFSTDLKDCFFATLVTCIALPLIPASNQIYPDIIAGIIALSGIYWFATTSIQRTLTKEILWTCAIVFLPWLQIKFVVTCALLVVAIGFRIYSESKDIKRITIMLGVAIFSFITLGYYNNYAFGSFSGPYQSEALELSQTSFMVLLGLHFDQNQGFLLQNPIFLAGLFSIGPLFSRNKRVTLILLLVFLTLIVPNAMHPNWYGGWSFSGRFGWSAAVVFFLPTVFGLVRLAKINAKVIGLVLGFSLLLQGYFFYQYTWGDISLYNKAPNTWLSNYSIFYYPIQSWMPALYDANWAYSHVPNLGWLIFISLIFALGFGVSRNIEKVSKKLVIAFLIVSLFIILVSGFFSKAGNEEIVFLGRDLPSQSGYVQGDNRVATQGINDPGFVTYGPYFPLRAGLYRVMMRYSSDAPIQQLIGTWDIIDANTGAQIAEYPLYGTLGMFETVEVEFEIQKWNPHSFEFRSFWNGVSEIKITSIALKHLDRSNFK